MIVFYAHNDFQSLNIGVRERENVKMKTLCWSELTIFCPECIFGFYSSLWELPSSRRLRCCFSLCLYKWCLRTWQVCFWNSTWRICQLLDINDRCFNEMEQWNKFGWEGYAADVQSTGLVCVGTEVFLFLPFSTFVETW